jgi:hypothetical protein
MVQIISGTGVGQAPRLITDYVGATKVANVAPGWAVTPDNTSVFEVRVWAGIDIESYGGTQIGATPMASHGFIPVDLQTWADDFVCDLTTSATGGMVPSANTITAGTAAAGAATTITLGTAFSGYPAASATSSVYNGARILITGGTGIGQERVITAYNGGTKVATVDTAWTTNPDATSKYVILAGGRADPTAVVASVTGAVGSVTGSVGSVAAGGIARASFAQDAKDMLGEGRRNTAAGGSTTTITLDAGASAVDDFYNGYTLLTVSGTGANQTANISDYNGTTKVATLDRTLATGLDNTTVFELLAQGYSTAVGGGGGAWAWPHASYDLQTVAVDSSDAVFFTLVDSSGNRVTNATLEINAMLSVNGAAAVSPAGTFGEIDAGDMPGEYYYIPDPTEVTDPHTIVLYLEPGDSTFLPCSVAFKVAADTISSLEDYMDENVGPSVWNFAPGTEMPGFGTNPGRVAEWLMAAGRRTDHSFASGITIGANSFVGAAIGDGTSFDDDDFVGHTVVFTRDDGSGNVIDILQACTVTDYDQGTNTFTFTPAAWTRTQTNATGYMVLADGVGASSPMTIASAVWDEPRAGHATAGTFGEGVVVSSLATAALTAIRDKLLDYEYRTGRTVRGLFRRWGALIEGRVTGLLGSLVTAYQPGGVTSEFSAAQDTAAGNRSEATVTNSETP